MTYLFYNWKCVPFDHLSHLAHPDPLPLLSTPVYSLHLCTWAFCFILFLNSTCNEIIWCLVFVFLSLTYFIWHNVLRVQDGLINIVYWYFLLTDVYRHTDIQVIQSQNILTFFWQLHFTEGELEAEWLQDVGLSTLISGDEEEDGKALLSTLTRTQAAAVKKRYNTYTQTLRKKNKQSVRDVRDIFGASESPVSNGQGSKGMIRGAEEYMEKISGKFIVTL